MKDTCAFKLVCELHLAGMNVPTPEHSIISSRASTCPQLKDVITETLLQTRGASQRSRKENLNKMATRFH